MDSLHKSASYDIGGVRYPQPFKIRRLGHFGFNVADLQGAAELERAKAGRTSEPRPWNRLAARLFDYAIWGLVLALLLSELRGAGATSQNLTLDDMQAIKSQLGSSIKAIEAEQQAGRVSALLGGRGARLTCARGSSLRGRFLHGDSPNSER